MGFRKNSEPHDFKKREVMSAAVQFSHISKDFSGVKVLKEISFTINKNEIHALLGENGAGKSTLLNILHGVYAEYDGDVLLHGQKMNFRNPHDAIVDGKISKVHQEAHAIRDLTVGQNVTLGYEPVKGGFVDYKSLNRSVDALLKRLNCRFKSSDLVSGLSAGEIQIIGIAKALFHNSSIISLDEPTTSLTTNETDALFNILRELKNSGITIIYVSHRLEEIFQLCDRASILRDGQYITTLDVPKTDRETIIRNMVGYNVTVLKAQRDKKSEDRPTVLKISDFTRRPFFENINFELKQGEILGFSGLVGSGRTEVMRAVFGADRIDSGKLFLKGSEVKIRNTTDALSLGFGLLPEERKSQGFIHGQTNIENMALSALPKFMSGWFVDNGKKYRNCVRFIEKLNVNPKRPDYETQNISGGNQQKIILGKWLSTDADILIFDEPTKGIDIAAKAEIYKIMKELAANGKFIIVVSSELPEIMGISDRIIVMCEGKITAELYPEDFEEEKILSYAMEKKNHD